MPKTVKLLNYLIMKTLPKSILTRIEAINGSWYAVSVQAYTIKEAIKSLYIGQRKPYGTVEGIKGRFTLNN